MARKKLVDETAETLGRRVHDVLEYGEVLARGVRVLASNDDGYRAKEWDRGREALFELLRRLEEREGVES